MVCAKRAVSSLPDLTIPLTILLIVSQQVAALIERISLRPEAEKEVERLANGGETNHGDCVPPGNHSDCSNWQRIWGLRPRPAAPNRIRAIGSMSALINSGS